METIYRTVTINTHEQYLPPRARKLRERSVSFEHAVQLESHPASQAPVAFRIERPESRYDEKKSVDIRALGDHLYRELDESRLPTELRMYESDRFACARAAEAEFENIVLIDGKPWAKCGEPVYTYDRGRFSDYEWIAAKTWDEQSVGDFFFNANELDDAVASAKEQYRNVAANEKIVVIDPSYVRFGSREERVKQSVADMKSKLAEHMSAIHAEEDPHVLYDLIKDLERDMDGMASTMLRNSR